MISFLINKTEELIKTDLIVKRMMWYFVHSKALKIVTPELIRQNYRLYLEKNPPLDQWKYQVISIKGKEEKLEGFSKEIYALLEKNKKPLEELNDSFKEIEKTYPENSIQTSPFYESTSKDLSKNHKEILKSLKEESYSNPINQISKIDNKKLIRIFYLKHHELKTPPSFDEMADKVKEELLQQAVAEESNNYFNKLYKYYNIDENEILPENFEPFSLK
jgi:hypothetical protein